MDKMQQALKVDPVIEMQRALEVVLIVDIQRASKGENWIKVL